MRAVRAVRAPWGVRGRCRDCDRGAGTVLVIALVAVVFVLAAGLGVVARGHLDRARAQAAADLAALAAAGSIAVPAGVALAAPARRDPCALAGEVAGRNAAAVDRCTVVTGGVVEVRVRAGGAAATASAGPRSARAP